MNIDGDHSKSVKHIMKAGIRCFMSEGTGKALNLYSHRLKIVKAKKPFQVGTFGIMPFDVNHDASEPLGFLFQSGKDKLLFLTDSFYVKYRFPGLTHIMIETNYSKDLLEKNIKSGLVSESLRNRIVKSHFSLNNVKEFLKSNDLSKCKEIHLIHLSKNNSDPELFKKEIQGICGVPTFIGGEE